MKIYVDDIVRYQGADWLVVRVDGPLLDLRLIEVEDGRVLEGSLIATANIGLIEWHGLTLERKR
jgi:hypothetical protein